MKNYALPGMPDWSFQIDKGQNLLLNKVGIGCYIDADMTVEAITERIEKILRNNIGLTDEAAIDAVVQAARNIDWQKTIAKPVPELVAVLVNEPTANAQEMIPATQLDKIYDNLKSAYFAIKKYDPREGK